jgi:hydrogenase-4 component E
MLSFLIILFALTLIYLSISERFRSFSNLIALQGLLLFGIAIIELEAVNTANLIFIVTETIVFKAIVVPVILHRIINRIKIYRVHSKALPGFYLLLFTIIGLFLSIVLANALMDKYVDTVFLTIAMFTLFTGLLIIITHKLIFSHMIGFLVVENAVFLFSMVAGKEMPMLINIGILLDIFASVLIIGIFINKIGSQYKDLMADTLTSLKN